MQARAILTPAVALALALSCVGEAHADIFSFTTQREKPADAEKRRQQEEAQRRLNSPEEKARLLEIEKEKQRQKIRKQLRQDMAKSTRAVVDVEAPKYRNNPEAKPHAR